MTETNANTITDAAMEPLRRKYAARLGERAQAIAELLVRVEQGDFTAKNRDQLQSHAHSLAGSGAIYGHPDISKAGRALEEALEGGATPALFLPLAETLLGLCRMASDGVPVPVMPQAASAEKPTAMNPPLAVLQSKVARRKTILVIDDDADVRDIVTETLKNDAEVVTANDGESGLAAIRASRPDLVLLDVNMPGMKGLNLLEMLQSDGALRDLPIVMLSARREGTDVTQAVLSGAVGYIVKPFDPAAMAAKIRTLLMRFDTTVLLADDDDSIRDLLRHKFRCAGVNVLQAADGEEALSLAVAHKPQLAIIDWMMPGLDGLALLRKIREKPETRDTRVVMLTVRRRERDILDGLRFSAEDYILKPFMPEEVMARCFRLLGLTEGMQR